MLSLKEYARRALIRGKYCWCARMKMRPFYKYSVHWPTGEPDEIEFHFHNALRAIARAVIQITDRCSSEQVLKGNVWRRTLSSVSAGQSSTT
jgi:hypothetical protein